MELRRLRADEVDRFLETLWLPFADEMAALDSYNTLTPDPLESAREYRQEQLADEDVRLFVAVAGETLTGYTCVAVSDSPPVFARGAEANIEELYVKPERRGEGIATALLDRAEAWGQERGCERATLAANAENHRALEFYESRGYTVRRHKLDTDLA